MNILALFGIANAYAADAAAPAPQGSLLSMLPLFLILIFFMYFMVIRPQMKRAKEQRTLVGSLKVGDEVLTTGGILGRIEKINNDFILLAVSENMNIKVQKNAVAGCVPKGTIKSVE
ncbi:MAG: preprotein translocase subunit YajC [Gammaproteobacteria bacterium]